MIFEFNGWKPIIHPSSFVHPQATVTGNVIIGKDVYIGPHAAIRGDWGEVIIYDGANVQESCTIHMFPGKKAILHQSAHIGHGAVIHGAIIGENTLIGMNSVVMDDAVIEQECIIGALSFIKADMIIPKRTIYAGNPAKYIKDVTDEMLQWKTEGTKLYQSLPSECFNTLKPCTPLETIPVNRPKMEEIYKRFNK
ncbi:MAG: transferase hexapeptide repeat family protein [Saprospiraceae bacterium]